MIPHKSEQALGEAQRKRYAGQREPVAWSEELWQSILQYMRSGASVHFVAAAAGITSQRLRGWLEDSEVMREEFLLAEEHGHLRMFAELRQASTGDIKGLQWLLQRRYPEVWKERQTIEFQGDADAAMSAMDKLERLITSCKEELADGGEQGAMAGDAAPED